ncbi:Poxvirus A22-like protein [Paramecium bursaria Chlorella virus NE-JV-1]|nr:Poxvirus A22-like protein [Paramecium bursaria Chlorella virus NE-JV-1]
MIIGIDPGTKNLGLCMIDENDKIVKWEVISISPDPKGIFDGLNKIQFSEWVNKSSDVVIERQPSKNPRAVRIQNYLEMFAASHDGRMYTMDPKHKLSYACTTRWWPQRDVVSWSYGERKKLAVETVDSFVKSTEQNPAFVDFFERSKKKDDLADCLLHALAFKYNIKPFLSDARRPASVRNIKAVKPSEAQLKSGKYSQAGLKFLAKGLLGSFEAFERGVENIHGFQASASKHFDTLDNCYTQLGGR